MTPVQPLPSVFIIIILIITTTTKTPLEFFIITHVIIIITPHCDFHGYNSHQSTTRLEKRLLLLLNAWWCSNSCIKPGAGFQLKTKTTEERSVGVMHFRQYIYWTTMSQPTLVVFSAPPYINDDYVRSRDISHWQCFLRRSDYVLMVGLQPTDVEVYLRKYVMWWSWMCCLNKWQQRSQQSFHWLHRPMTAWTAFTWSKTASIKKQVRWRR